MKAKEYLQQYRETLERTQEITDHLTELKAEAERLKDHEGQSIQLDDAVAKYVDACDNAAEYLEALSNIRKEIFGTIEKVNDKTLRTLLRYRYIHGMTWERVAVAMNYSWRQTIRLHGTALTAVKDVIECHTESVL